MTSRVPAVSLVGTALLALLAAWLLLLWAEPAIGAPAEADQRAAEAAAGQDADRLRALQRAQDAVLGVHVQALPDARSNATLGPLRQGSGVVIGDDGLVLTIGYLVLEADQVMLLPDDGRAVPARVLGYDLATGFGLLQALAPLRIQPAPLAAGGAPRSDEALMVTSGGQQGAVSLARLVARRPFSGYWEYHLDEALITAPARHDHSGAGLFNPRGELVGIGSLVLADTAEPAEPRPPGQRVQGNLFVPVALLHPILAELRRAGTTSASQRPWLGLNCVEQAGGVRVLRVSDDSPADVAGLQAGDRILRIDGTEVHTLAELWKGLWADRRPEREVLLEIQRQGERQTLKVFSVDRMKTLRRPEVI